MARWGHGLFRLWVVLSVLWVSLFGVAIWLEIPIEKPCMYSAATMPIPPPFECTKPAPNPFDQFDSPQKAEPIEFKMSVFAKIIGPPIFVLLIGCALWWVLRGFQPREN
jgi:hypothetical protein